MFQIVSNLDFIKNTDKRHIGVEESLLKNFLNVIQLSYNHNCKVYEVKMQADLLLSSLGANVFRHT